MSKEYRFSFVIDGDDEKGTKALRRVKEEVEKLNQAQQDQANASKEQNSWLDKAMGSMSKYALVAGGTAVAATLVFAKQAINAADAMDEMSQRTGVTVESLAGLEWAAKLSGTNLETVTKALKSVSTQALDAQRGLRTSQENFDALGISVTDSSGALKTSEALLIEAADSFASMRNETEKTALATKLFGRAGLELIPMLDQGSAGIAALVAEGQRLNPITAESAAMAGDFNDNLDRLGGSLKATGISILNDALPHLVSWSDGLLMVFDRTAWLDQQAKDYTETLQAQLGVVRALTQEDIISRAVQLGNELGEMKQRLADLHDVSSTGATRFKQNFLGGFLRDNEAEELTVKIEAASAAYAELVGRLRELQGGAAPVVDVIGGPGGLTDEQQKLIDKTRELTDKIAIERAQLAMTGREAAIFKAVWEAHNAGSAPEAIQLIAETTGALYDQQQQIEASAAAAKGRAAAEEQAAKDMAKAHEKAASDMQRAQEQAAEEMRRDWERTHEFLTKTFVDIFDSGGSAFEKLGDAAVATAKRIAAEWLALRAMNLFGVPAPSSVGGGAGFFGGGTGSAGGIFSGAGTAGNIFSGAGTASGIAAGVSGAASVFGTSGAVISAAEYGMLTGGATVGAGGAAGAGMAAGLKAALTAIPGWGWALAGAAALTMMFSEKSTPSWNAGFLTDPNTPLGKSGKSFQTEAFASGFAPTGFYRRSTEQEAEQVIDLFRQVDSAIVELGRTAGLTVSASGSQFRGLSERLLTGTSGTVFGAGGEDGAPGLSIETQLDMYARQLVETLRGQLDDATINMILSSGDVMGALDTALAPLRQALEETSTTAEEATQALIDTAKAAADFAAMKSDLLDRYATDDQLLQQSREAIAAAAAEFGVAIPQTAEDLRALIAAIDPMSERGAEALQAVEALGGAFGRVFGAGAQAAEDAARVAEEAAQAAEATLAELAEQAMLAAEAAAAHRQGAYEGTVEAIRINMELQAERKRQFEAELAAEAEQRALSLAAQTEWQQRIDLLLGNTTQRQIEQASALATATDDATKALVKQYFAELDMVDVRTAAAQEAEAAAAREMQISENRARWQQELDLLQGRITSQELELQRALASVTDDTTRSLIEQVYAQRALNDAAADAASAANAQRSKYGADRSATVNGTHHVFNPDAIDMQRIAQVAASRYGGNQGQIVLRDNQFYDTVTGEYISGYASGGTHAGGLRVVGESGPELEFTGPSHIVSNINSAALVNGSVDTARETQQLRREVSVLRDQVGQQMGKLLTVMEAVAFNTGQSGRALNDAVRNGAGTLAVTVID